MATFVAISGPSSTGKTSLVNALSTHLELSEAVFSPDLYDTVWSSLVSQGIFKEWTEVNTDSSYLCVLIYRLIEYYEDYINQYKDTDKLVILDGCWLDLSVYSLINLWYNRTIKSVQEDIFHRINKFSDDISRIYITNFDKSKQIDRKFYRQYKISNMKLNRPLEIQYYELFKHFKNTISLPSSEISDESLFIIDDLKNLGYV